VTPLPLFYGEVSADLALGSEDSPIFIDGASAIIRYDCFGGTSLGVALEVDSLKIGEAFELRALKITFTVERCRLTASKSVLKVPMVSALETKVV